MIEYCPKNYDLDPRIENYEFDIEMQDNISDYDFSEDYTDVLLKQYNGRITYQKKQCLYIVWGICFGKKVMFAKVPDIKDAIEMYEQSSKWIEKIENSIGKRSVILNIKDYNFLVDKYNKYLKGRKQNKFKKIKQRNGVRIEDGN